MDFGLVNLRSTCENQMKNGINQNSVVDILNLVRKVNNNSKSTRKQREYAVEIESMCLNYISKNFTTINMKNFSEPNIICDILEIIQLQIKSDRKWKYQSENTPIEIEDQVKKKEYCPSRF